MHRLDSTRRHGSGHNERTFRLPYIYSNASTSLNKPWPLRAATENCSRNRLGVVDYYYSLHWSAMSYVPVREYDEPLCRSMPVLRQSREPLTRQTIRWLNARTRVVRCDASTRCSSVLQTAWESDEAEAVASEKSWNLQGWLSVGTHKLVQQTLRALVRRCSHPYAVRRL